MKKLAALEIIYFYTAAVPGCHLHLSNLWRIEQRQRWLNSMFSKCFEILVLKGVEMEKNKIICVILQTDVK